MQRVRSRRPTSRLPITTTLLVAIFCALPPSVSAEFLESDQSTIKILRERLVETHMYPRMECLTFGVEENDSTTVSITLREVHNETCGGDPGVEPIIDRYRVIRSSKQIEWYDVIQDEYRPFSEAVRSRQGQ